jgi:hypothetical protein
LLLGALIPLSFAVAARQPRPTADTSRQIHCEVIPDAPMRDNDQKPTKIVGKVRFRCDEPGAASLSLKIHLQHQNSAGDWLDIASSSFTASGSQTVGTRDQRLRTREVSGTCGEGAFRLYIKGNASARGKTKTYDRAGPRNFDPCRPSMFFARG